MMVLVVCGDAGGVCVVVLVGVYVDGVSRCESVCVSWVVCVIPVGGEWVGCESW